MPISVAIHALETQEERQLVMFLRDVQQMNICRLGTGSLLAISALDTEARSTKIPVSV